MHQPSRPLSQTLGCRLHFGYLRLAYARLSSQMLRTGFKAAGSYSEGSLLAPVTVVEPNSWEFLPAVLLQNLPVPGASHVSTTVEPTPSFLQCVVRSHQVPGIGVAATACYQSS